MPRKTPVALGIKAHIGWGAVVALAGPADEPRVVAKHRIDMARTFATGAVYHAAQEMTLADAEAHVRRATEAFRKLATTAMKAFLAELGEGFAPFGTALVSGSARPLPSLETIVRSHALVHAAEGELYRAVLAAASEACGLAVVRVPGKELAARAAKAVRSSEPVLARRVAAIGKASGRPWTVDQKEATLAAWLLLAREAG